MYTAQIDIHTDMDFDVVSMFGTHHENYSFDLHDEDLSSLRQEVILFLAMLEIRLPYAQEYSDEFYHSQNNGQKMAVDEFKANVYEAIHHVCTHGDDANWYRGGNRVLSIRFFDSNLLKSDQKS